MAAALASKPATRGWRIIPRPILETILNNYAANHRVPQPLLLHGPRGVGKTSLFVHRLLDGWNRSPHLAGYVDFAADLPSPPPWCSHPTGDISSLRRRLEVEIESMADQAVRIGAIGSKDVFQTLNKNHGILSALRRLTGIDSSSSRASLSALWNRAVASRVTRGAAEIEDFASRSAYSREEVAHVREAEAALRVAREVLEMHGQWRREAVREMNRRKVFARTLVHSATDWPCLLLELLSNAAEMDFFQPKLIINNIDVLRKAISTDDSTVPAAMYHDSFIWRLIALGVNERSLPVFLVSSDGYYSYQAFVDFGFPDIFLSRETYGWTHQEAKLHMVSDFFSEPEWKVIDEVLGPNPRQLSELYTLKQSTHYNQFMKEKSCSFEDVVDAYLAYLQVGVVNPAMESALCILQKFASDARNGKIPDDRLPFGAPWRHPPRIDDPAVSLKWARIQLMDFVQSLVNAEFGVNYLSDYYLEFLDDPAAVAMLEVGLLYQQRDPSFIRPITRGIQRCLVRWLVQERMQMNFQESTIFLWHRIIRGRSYRHLMKELGYK